MTFSIAAIENVTKRDVLRPPNPDAGPFLWRTIGSGGLPVPVLPNVNLILEDYWARFDGLRLLAPFNLRIVKHNDLDV